MLRCLIIDDSPQFLDIARILLERQGIAVVGTAMTGADGLRQAADLRPDVTLVDITLGDESGLELTERLVSEGSVPPSSMILISTHAEEDYAELVEASPAAGFLPKTTLSAQAIRDLLDDVSRPPGR
ncbi:response regulator [Actinomadura chibensis]|uniref:Response regulator n=1 Tax=Actinomadura chibensis TaxID=392828 RepID=A0A5D0NBR8_9ACTN|nr:response regulator transcription factor [Actinomadura chibensis]TYB41832.1 response regulator [Actinomadura chibensis]